MLESRNAKVDLERIRELNYGKKKTDKDASQPWASGVGYGHSGTEGGATWDVAATEKAQAQGVPFTCEVHVASHAFNPCVPRILLYAAGRSLYLAQSPISLPPLQGRGWKWETGRNGLALTLLAFASYLDRSGH